MDTNDLYPGRDNYYKKQSEDINNDPNTSENNKKDIQNFALSCLSKSKTKQYRVGKLLSQLRLIYGWMDCDLRSITMSNLHKVIATINTLDRSEATKADYRRALKQFYFWFEENDDRLSPENPVLSREVSKFYKYIKKEVKLCYEKPRIDPAEIINDVDAKLLIEKGCINFQEKALISTLYETGMRTSELLWIKIKGFTMDSNGVGTIYTGDGRTGKRLVYVIQSVPYIQDHLKLHIDKNNPDAYLFYFVDERSGKVHPFNHMRLYQRVWHIFKRANVKKKHNIHWMRHSKASRDAIEGKMSESVRKRLMGWKDDTKMMATYVHLGNREVKNAWLNAQGIKADQEEKKEKLMTCICTFTFSDTYKHCPRCGRPVSANVVMEEKNREKQFQEEMKELFVLSPDDPHLKREFANVLRYALEMSQDPAKLDEFEVFRKRYRER